MYTIQLFKSYSDNAWFSLWDDPQVMQAFGTDVLPTPYNCDVNADIVLNKIQELNPDCSVTIK